MAVLNILIVLLWTLPNVLFSCVVSVVFNGVSSIPETVLFCFEDIRYARKIFVNRKYFSKLNKDNMWNLTKKLGSESELATFIIGSDIHQLNKGIHYFAKGNGVIIPLTKNNYRKDYIVLE